MAGESRDIQNERANVVGGETKTALVLSVSNERPKAILIGCGALDSGHAAQQRLDLAVLHHLAKESLLQRVEWRLEVLVGFARLPLASVCVRMLRRGPAGQDVVHDVIVGVDEAGKDEGVGHRDGCGSSRNRARDGVALDDQHAIERFVGRDEHPLDDRLGGVGSHRHTGR